jgi:hypothetical protein
MSLKSLKNYSFDGGWNEEDRMCASPGPVAAGGSAGPTGRLVVCV